MLAELLVPIFLPGIAFLAILVVLKPEQRGRWSGLVGGSVLTLATLVGFAYEGAWPSSFSDWHRLPLILGGAGLLSAGLCWLPSGVRGWFAPLALGALAGFFGAFPDVEISDQFLWAQCCCVRQMVDVGLSSHVGPLGWTWRVGFLRCAGPDGPRRGIHNAHDLVCFGCHGRRGPGAGATIAHPQWWRRDGAGRLVAPFGLVWLLV